MIPKKWGHVAAALCSGDSSAIAGRGSRAPVACKHGLAVDG